MTYSLSHEAKRFLANGPVATVSGIRDDKTVVPGEPGIYGWWFDQSLLADVSEKVLFSGDMRLLYIGIAPHAATKAGVKARTLRDRLNDHCRGPISTSTLRRTLAALIRSQEEFNIERTAMGKHRMSVGDEARLTGWMSVHTRVMWSTTPQPWLVEDELLKHGPRLPLNIKGSTDPFRFELKRLRAETSNMATKSDERFIDEYPTDPGRFAANAEDIRPLGKGTIVDMLTDKQRAQNAEHDRIVKDAIKDL